jgi:hypothetical protein
MLGDIEMADHDLRNSTNRLAYVEEAIKYFDRITNERVFPGNPLVHLARARLGDCHFMLGVQYTNSYDQAAAYYSAVIAPNSTADIATRSRAEVGLARVLMRMAEQRPGGRDYLDQALDHCLNVVYSKGLRKGEAPDPFAVKEAALLAGTLAERLHRLDEAQQLYEGMMTSFPSLRGEWERRLELVRQLKAK